ncbi:M48 family metallopeptidase [Paracoccus mutanolyticus]|uniref:M48 family metallopeptidase n=1 Tax=Paracoccus mutanolyticus TaxID=1499308 RepID=UPI001CB93CA6|nr:M48 family metallopeptidase [Paracoccus mutanolyticus]
MAAPGPGRDAGGSAGGSGRLPAGRGAGALHHPGAGARGPHRGRCAAGSAGPAGGGRGGGVPQAPGPGPLDVACDRHAGAAGPAVPGHRAGEPGSRWGCCSHDGRLMFSWRLAMAPPAVLDYVAAHEVAHLAHMDHSAAFWATTAALCPDWRAQRGWLRTNGHDLLAWRFRAD